jgi:hypothetical protein
MGWLIECTDRTCSAKTWAANIVDLIQKHTDNAGWLRCACGKPGYIEKKFDLQEPGETWKPFLRAVIPLGDTKDTYQPFVFLVSYEPEGSPSDVWFCYYKDLRGYVEGGRLKLGYGPGGPPVLNSAQLLHLLKGLLSINCLKVEDVESLIKK